MVCNYIFIKMKILQFIGTVGFRKKVHGVWQDTEQVYVQAYTICFFPLPFTVLVIIVRLHDD